VRLLAEHAKLGHRCQVWPEDVVSLPGAGAYKGMCDLQLTGANELAPLLIGGLDGIYKLHTCENGRPAFKRATGPEHGQCPDASCPASACACWRNDLEVLMACPAHCRGTAVVVLDEA
jgi:hypothetical protein